MHASRLFSPAPRLTRIRFALLAAVQSMLHIAVTVTSAAGPAIQDELRLSRPELALAAAAYGLSFSGLLLLGGRLTDIVGRRRQFTLGVALFAAATAAVALAPGGQALIAARFAQGCGAALAAPAAMALLGGVFPEPAARRRALAVWGFLAGLGAATGIVLSGTLATWLSWRWGFGLLAAAAAAAVPAARLLPPGDAPRRLRVDVLGALLGTAALSALGYGLVMLGPRGWSSPYAQLPLAAGVVALALFAVRQARTAAPLLPAGLFADRQRATALAAAMFGPAAGASTAFLMALYLEEACSYSALRTSLVFIPYTVVLFAAGRLAGRAVARFTARGVAVTGLLTIAAGLFLVGHLPARSPHLSAPVVAGLLLLPLGIAVLGSAAVVLAVSGLPQRDAGPAGGVVNAALLIGSTAGVALMSSLAAARTGALDAAGRPAAEVGGPAEVGGYAFAFTVAAAVLLLAAPLAGYGLRRQASLDN
ncbi:MFS transporter [Streptomyces boninensis]|uniref:MFS transporter n=1 Tax=Streptomyces boninensis TaxID=2039455 RepID=UPI003B225D55